MELAKEEYQDPVQVEAEREARRARIEAFAEGLLKKRAEAVEYRSASGVERRWEEDGIIFDGLDGIGKNAMLDYATGEATPGTKKNEARRSKVVVNIIRGRCETAEGRFSDIQLPTDDRNWGMRITPVPELSERMKDKRGAMQDGKPITDQQGKKKTIADIAKFERDSATKAMQLMETEIDDQLTECDFNGESRKVIRQAIRLGTGILKGPSVVKSVHRKWTKKTGATGTSVYVMETEEVHQPESVWVDCWNVYPSPGTKENVQKTAEYIWEKDEILPRDVRKLIGVEGYDDELLKLVLSEEPNRFSAAFDDKKKQYSSATTRTRQGKAYEKWEYHGDVNREDLEAMGCDCTDMSGASVSACVVFINDKPVKAELNTLDTGALPYDFFQWTVVSSDEPWGIGIPRMMIWLQRIITAAWREMMNNAGDSSGANIVVGKGIQPADGSWVIGGRKIWINTGDIEDARQAFAQFQLANNQADLQNIIELALRFVDLETSMPTIFQGETQSAPKTLGETNILVDSSNTGVRQRVKLYDDRITKPHITRYYHHNMQYSDKDEIKGDFNVDARGVSVLLEKDQQSQTLLQVFALKADPDINLITDWEKAARQFYASRRLDILKSDEDIELARKQMEQQGPPPDPAVEVAKVRIEGELNKEKLRQQNTIAELQFKSQESEKQRQHEARMEELRLKTKMMEFSMQTNIALDKLKAQLAISGEGMNLQRELSGQRNQGYRGKRKAVPEVVTPPVEPAGKAPVGESFPR